MTTPYTIRFSDVDLSHVPKVGGKNASLGEMLQHLGEMGVRVPDGFALTADAYRRHLQDNALEADIYARLDDLDVRDVAQLRRVARHVRERIRSAPLPKEVRQQLCASYDALSAGYGEEQTDVAVRSSATAEDLPSASFAGQQETYLNVRGHAALIEATLNCMASLFTDRAIVYRAERGFDHRAVALSVGIQKMVRSDRASAGVIFTLDTETGFRDAVVITAAYGLGETVVQGRVDPDEYWVHKPTLERGFDSLIKRELGGKAVKLVYADGGEQSVSEVPVPPQERERFVLSPAEILQLARWAVRIEQYYSASAGRPTPMDIEWAKDGPDGEMFVVQARPETVHSQRPSRDLSVYHLQQKGAVLVSGKSVGEAIGAGRVRVVRGTQDLSQFEDGEVLVASMTDPDWEPVLKRATAVITDHGGRTCHAAIVARELGIPCVVGTGNATATLETGQEVTVCCAQGSTGKVYRGILPFERESIDAGDLPVPRIDVMLNVGNPEVAFRAALLPSAGVGLARIEFIINSWIGIHPMALLHPERVAPAEVMEDIARRTRSYESPREFFVARLASGVAQIAAAFFPRPVIVRFSDFKSNEYASLLGGTAFEPVESNPMIGFRGASRYYDPRYQEAFALECEAIARVRGRMGLDNVKVMIPFCRTLQEGARVLEVMEANGLVRGRAGLEVYVMCEIPNNVILAEEFSDLFDGFSIGSNDLTQLTLGVDRDSELLSHVFNERDPGVKAMIEMVIERAHSRGRKVGLCGQAPSDHPEFALFLEKAGIDSISVTPDALPKVLRLLAVAPRAESRSAVSGDRAG